jgi:hypothetical protein
MALGIVLTIFETNTFLYSFREEIDINKSQENQINETNRYYGDISAIVDCYAVKSDYVKNGSSSPFLYLQDNNCYYILPIADNKYIGLEVSSYKREDYDNLVEETQKYIQGETTALDTTLISFQGIARKMTQDESELFYSWFIETKFLGTTDKSEIQNYIILYNLSAKPFTAARILFITGILLFSIAIILLISSFIRLRNKSKAEFHLVKEGKSLKVLYFWVIRDALFSLDDSESKYIEVNINPSVAGISYMKAEASSTECNYIIEYSIERKGVTKHNKIESTNLKFIVEQFRRVYEEGRTPSQN